MWRSIASNALTLMIVVLIGFGAIVGWGQSQYRSAGPLEGGACLRVAPGATFNRVSEDLAEMGAVRDPRILRIGVRYADKAQDLKAGSFLLPEAASMEEIVAIVTEGGPSTCGTEVVYRIGVTRMDVRVRELNPETGRYDVTLEFDIGDPVPAGFAERQGEADARFRVALAEGVTSWQVVEGLKAVDVLTGQIAEVPLEGRLAPDSYEIRAGDDRAGLLAEMEARQAERLTAAWLGRAPDLPYDTAEEALIMASIIEKETAVPDERRQVASVFINRLRRDPPMRLQTDPTVIYGITEGRGVLGRGLRRSELDRATPYNTYVIEGLPPTPIANPGQASIEAAVNPDGSDYLFFVAKTLNPRDGHNFSVDYATHQRFVEAYRALEAAAE
jgi:UPF0755 protein